MSIREREGDRRIRLERSVRIEDREERPGVMTRYSNAQRAWFISDQHIGAGGITDDTIGMFPSIETQLWGFVEYLNWCNAQPRTHDQVILGDFGDYWDQSQDLPHVRYAENIYRQHPKAFEALKQFQGDLYIIRGNHDDVIANELGRLIGHPRTVISDKYRNSTLRIYAEHGHQFDEDNQEGINSMGYRLVRDIIQKWEKRIPNIDNIRPMEYDNLRAFVEREIIDPKIREELRQDLIEFAKREAPWYAPSFLVGEGSVRSRLREDREDKLDKLADRINDVYDDEASPNYKPCIFIFGHSHIPEYYGDHSFDPPQRAASGLTRKMAYINTGAWTPTLFISSRGEYASPQPLQSMRPFACVRGGPEGIYADLYRFNYYPCIPPGDATDSFDTGDMDRTYKLFGLRLSNDEEIFWDEMDL